MRKSLIVAVVAVLAMLPLNANAQAQQGSPAPLIGEAVHQSQPSFQRLINADPLSFTQNTCSRRGAWCVHDVSERGRHLGPRGEWRLDQCQHAFDSCIATGTYVRPGSGRTDYYVGRE